MHLGRRSLADAAPTHHAATTTPPLADEHGPLVDGGPAPPADRRPAAPPTDQLAQARTSAARVTAWLHVLRACEAAYAQQATAAGSSVVPLGEDEQRAAAQLAAALGVSPDAALMDRLTALFHAA